MFFFYFLSINFVHVLSQTALFALSLYFLTLLSLNFLTPLSPPLNVYFLSLLAAYGVFLFLYSPLTTSLAIFVSTFYSTFSLYSPSSIINVCSTTFSFHFPFQHFLINFLFYPFSLLQPIFSDFLQYFLSPLLFCLLSSHCNSILLL